MSITSALKLLAQQLTQMINSTAHKALELLILRLKDSIRDKSAGFQIKVKKVTSPSWCLHVTEQACMTLVWCVTLLLFQCDTKLKSSATVAQSLEHRAEKWKVPCSRPGLDKTWSTRGRCQNRAMPRYPQQSTLSLRGLATAQCPPPFVDLCICRLQMPPPPRSPWTRWMN